MGTHNPIQISAVAYQGISVTLPNGQPGRLAIIDEAGQILDDSPEVSKMAYKASVESYRNLLIAQGHMTVTVNLGNRKADIDRPTEEKGHDPVTSNGRPQTHGLGT